MIVIIDVKESEPKNNRPRTLFFLVWQIRLEGSFCARASEQGHSNKTQRTRDSIHNYRVIQRCDHDIVVCVYAADYCGECNKQCNCIVRREISHLF